MDKVYNFNWIVDDLYNSIIFKLYRIVDDMNVCFGTYEVNSILSSTGDELSVKFANIDNLSNLLNLSILRFVDINNMDNIIDIPLRNIYMLFNNSNNIGDSVNNYISLNDLDSFSVYDGEIINDNYNLFIYKISEPSEYLSKIMLLAKEFGNMGMQEKFDTITEVNLLNYQRVTNDIRLR